MTESVLPQSEIDAARTALQFFSSDWMGEVPYRIHESGHDTHYGLGSSPPFSPEFIGFIGGLTCRNEFCKRCRKRDTRAPRDDEGYQVQNHNARVKTTRAFRKLRRYAPLEYDVLWMAVMYHLNVTEITERLNSRAILKGHDDRYKASDVVILTVAALDKVSKWV